MNKNIVILSIIIVSVVSITPISASDNVIKETSNPLEDLWDNFVETITYIFTHDPQHVIEESEEIIDDVENVTTNEINITNSTTHNIHEENTIVSEELNNSYVTDDYKSSSDDLNKTNDVASE